MFGGFSPVPRKPGGLPPDKKLGVVHDEAIRVEPTQGTKGTFAAPRATPAAPERPKIGPETPILGPQDQTKASEPQKPAPIAPEASREVPKTQEIEAVWHGIIHGWSGYAKANREILRRVAAYGRIRFADQAHFDWADTEPQHVALLQLHRAISVSPSAPRVTFLPPFEEFMPGYRIIYTMMETDPVHKDMTSLMNERYQECWVPTQWNAETFRRAGLQMPIHVMPLGVDPSVYSQNVQPFIPKATLMTGPNAGRSEIPKGFLFINVFQPSFRKGHDVLIETFEETFANDSEVGLILGTTAYSLEDKFPWKSMKSRIWTLPGGYSERQLASIYKACKVYVTASRGEGWNLPLCEAGAVGLPAIAPRHTSHPEVLPDGCGYIFEPDVSRLFEEAERTCPWFAGIPFPDFGPKARRELAHLMRKVRKNYPEAQERSKKHRAFVSSKLTWSLTARRIAERLRAICARPNA